MLTSVVGRGQIYAGNTPLACSVLVEQTGPMELTVRAGSFTTTGQARIRQYDPQVHDSLIASRKCELLPDGKRIRGWIQDKIGKPIDISRTYRLPTDRVITLTSDPTRTVAYNIDLIGQNTIADVHVKRRIVGVEEYSPPAPGWSRIHELLFEFMLPSGAANITPIDIFTLTVKSGFPEGTDENDWLTQVGG